MLLVCEPGLGYAFLDLVTVIPQVTEANASMTASLRRGATCRSLFSSGFSAPSLRKTMLAKRRSWR
jgi:hypothetical protein